MPIADADAKPLRGFAHGQFQYTNSFILLLNICNLQMPNTNAMSIFIAVVVPSADADALGRC